MQTYKFSDLTADALNALVTLHDREVMPAMWDAMNAVLTGAERRQVKAVAASLLDHRVIQMNEATIWSRAIYPLLVLAEQGRLEAWAQVPLKAEYPAFRLEGIADGVIGRNISGIKKSFYVVVVEAKRGLEAPDPQVQLYGAMLAVARLNWEQNRETPQEVFGCYTVADNWTFVQGLASEFEAERPALTITSSREYTEKVEAEAILRLLKFITGKYAEKMAYAA